MTIPQLQSLPLLQHTYIRSAVALKSEVSINRHKLFTQLTICINLFLLTDRNGGNTVHSEMLSSDKTLKYSLSLENMGLSSLGTSTAFNNPAEFITGECCESSTVSPGGRVGDASSGEAKSGKVYSTGYYLILGGFPLILIH